MIIIIIEHKTVRFPAREIKSYLCRSVPVQKVLTELRPSGRGDECQGTVAKLCREEACQLHSGGWRVGLGAARASGSFVKRGGPPQWSSAPGAKRLSQGLAQVIGVVTRRKWFVFDTDESPTSSPLGVSPTYKAEPKWKDHAMARGGLPYGPPAWGWQQSRSSPLPHLPRGMGMKGKTLNRPQITWIFMVLVSPVAQATKWLARGPLRATHRLLRNSSNAIPASVAVNKISRASMCLLNV